MAESWHDDSHKPHVVGVEARNTKYLMQNMIRGAMSSDALLVGMSDALCVGMPDMFDISNSNCSVCLPTCANQS